MNSLTWHLQLVRTLLLCSLKVGLLSISIVYADVDVTLSTPERPPVPPAAAVYSQILAPPALPEIICFQSGPAFLPNPVSDKPVSVPPMPKSLSPLGANVTREEEHFRESESSHSLPDSLLSLFPSEPASLFPPVFHSRYQESIINDSPSETVTVAPFLQWMQLRQNAKNNSDSSKSDSAASSVSSQGQTPPAVAPSYFDDPFISIRFPYLGSQAAPPQSGAVIYSTPEK